MILQMCRICQPTCDKLRMGSWIIQYRCLFQIQKLKPKTLLVNKSIFLKRSFFNFVKKATNEEVRIQDGVSEQYRLIYKLKMQNYLLITQVTTAATAVIFGLMLVLAERKDKEREPPTLLETPLTQYEDVYIYIASLTTIVLLLQILLSKMPIRIYNFPQKRKYKLIFYGNIPTSRETLTCKVGELRELPEKGIGPWKNSRYLLHPGNHEKVIYLLEDDFKRPADLYIMMGVQKDPEVKDEVDDK